MSASLASVPTNTASWRKRSREDDNTTEMDLKRPRYYYYRLESESSKASEEDTESVCSLQDRETDVVRDTTDTDSKSGDSDQDEYEVHYEEYDVASLSESECSQATTSSDPEDMILAAAAAAMCDNSLEKWITDGEDSDNSSLEDSSFGKSDFSTCIQCKSANDNPLYRYCDKCFQSCRQCKMRKTFKCFPLCITCHKDRKKFYPPRPKRMRRSRNTRKKKPDHRVKLDTLRSCLSGLSSQDSGIGSSQECPPLDLDQIVVPSQHLTPGTSQISTIDETNEKVDDNKEKKIVSEDVTSSDIVVASNVKENCTTVVQEEKGSSTASTGNSTSTDFPDTSRLRRKRHLSESSLSDIKAKKPKNSGVLQYTNELSDKPQSLSQTSDLGSEISSSSFISSLIEKSSTESEGTKTSISDSSELCMFCNDAPKDAIFLHTKVAHQCCCYKCAKRTLKAIKRCPICNCPVNKVFRLIKS